ncbi:hypothetical protein MA16_Dca013038 [Dendrobium catenatum]|uniref:Uncharacterized protein n=1 Tax=Dendrobium catenatum TaxID=906689 RepID=A0A2I0X147_9ASPA|nr:hypothetical protein MA16_Dca013038 [Dendrobium catenatum]
MFRLLDRLEEEGGTPREIIDSSDLEEGELVKSSSKENAICNVITENKNDYVGATRNSARETVGSVSGNDSVSMIGNSKVKLSKDIKSLGPINSSLRINRNEGGGRKRIGGPSPLVIK